MLGILMAAALQIQCVDGVATVDQEIHETTIGKTIVWEADFAFDIVFESPPGPPRLPSTPHGGGYQRRLGAAVLGVGEHSYEIESEVCSGDPVIIVRER